MEEQRPNSNTIQSIGEIPNIQHIYTGVGNEYELPIHRREKCIAVGLENGEVWFIVDAQFAKEQGVVISSIREKMRAKSLKVTRTVIADVSLISIIYNTSSRLSDSAKSTEPAGAESALFDEFIRYGLRNRASDIHFEPRGQSAEVRYRIDGELELMRNETKGVFSLEQVRDSLGYAYNKLQSERTGSHASFSTDSMQSCMIPLTIDGRAMNMRWQSARAWGGFDIVLRYLVSNGPKTTNFEDLGYSDDQSKMLDIAARTRNGMVLIVGITGSGKSTTLKTVVANIPGKDGLKIFTIEDPVEDKVPGATQLSVQRTLQSDSDRVPMKELQGVLMRMDPDTIMQGEIRDKDSGESAQVFLETGHQVLATLHANSAIGAFPRLLSEAIGFTLGTITAKQFWSLIVYQALVPVLCSHCKIKAEDVIGSVTDFVAEKFKISTENTRIKNPDGCKHCDHRGTVDQTVVAEMIQPNRKLLMLIRQGDDYGAEQTWRETSDRKFDSPNMTGKTVFEHALYKAYTGEIDIRVVERFETFERYENIWEENQ